MVTEVGYTVGLIGCWICADGFASLWAYTGNSKRAKGQTFWRDHSLRVFRMLLGVLLMVLGYLGG